MSTENHALNFVLNSHLSKKEKEIKKHLENIEEIDEQVDKMPEPLKHLQTGKLTRRHKGSNIDELIRQVHSSSIVMTETSDNSFHVKRKPTEYFDFMTS